MSTTKFIPLPFWLLQMDMLTTYLFPLLENPRECTKWGEAQGANSTVWILLATVLIDNSMYTHTPTDMDISDVHVCWCTSHDIQHAWWPNHSALSLFFPVNWANGWSFCQVLVWWLRSIEAIKLDTQHMVLKWLRYMIDAEHSPDWGFRLEVGCFIIQCSVTLVCWVEDITLPLQRTRMASGIISMTALERWVQNEVKVACEFPPPPPPSPKIRRLPLNEWSRNLHICFFTSSKTSKSYLVSFVLKTGKGHEMTSAQLKMTKSSKKLSKISREPVLFNSSVLMIYLTYINCKKKFFYLLINLSLMKVQVRRARGFFCDPHDNGVPRARAPRGHPLGNGGWCLELWYRDEWRSGGYGGGHSHCVSGNIQVWRIACSCISGHEGCVGEPMVTTAWGTLNLHISITLCTVAACFTISAVLDPLPLFHLLPAIHGQ